MNFTKEDEYPRSIVSFSTVTGTSVCLSQPIISISAGGTCDSKPGVLCYGMFTFILCEFRLRAVAEISMLKKLRPKTLK